MNVNYYFQIKELKSECGKVMKILGLDSDQWTGRTVMKKYAFEIKDIPTELTEYFEVTYSGRVK